MIKKIIFIILLALISKNVYAQSDTIKMDSIMKTIELKGVVHGCFFQTG